VNDAPDANNDGPLTTAEDTALTNINVLGNDNTGPANESGQTLTVTLASALHGAVTINADGTLNYTPNADYNGADTITGDAGRNRTRPPPNSPMASCGIVFSWSDIFSIDLRAASEALRIASATSFALPNPQPTFPS